ncbi:MAG: VCBS repeat-containing protein [Candidatus Kerfeldbacteria bacterium]|nr:VCBS repeat-containing protein [Candidatus Kerfeldbacteria bacterium]
MKQRTKKAIFLGLTPGRWIAGVKTATSIVAILAMVGWQFVTTAQPVLAEGSVSGRIMAGGAPVGSNDARINIMQPFNPPTVPGTETASNGTFALAGVPAGGGYQVMVEVADSALAFMGTTVDNVTVNNNANSNLGDINLVPAPKTWRGRVTRASNGQGVEEVQVNAFRMDGQFQNAHATTDDDGDYLLHLTGGTWGLSLEAPRDQNGQPEDVDWVFVGQQPQVSFSNDATAQSKTTNLQVQNASATVSGRVLLPGGDPAQFIGLELRAGEMGIQGHTEQDGRFEIRAVPGSYELRGFLPPEQQQYTFPTRKLTVGEDDDLDLGTIRLGEKSSRIRGQVTCEDVPEQGVFVNAFQHEGMDFGMTQTDGNGNYSLPVSAGTWGVMVQQGVNSDCVFSGQPRDISLGDDQTKSGVDFELIRADVTVNVLVVDEEGNGIDNFFGFAFVHSNSGGKFGRNDFFGNPIQGGVAQIKFPSASMSEALVGVFPPPNSEFSLQEEVELDVEPNQMYNVPLVMLANDAVLMGEVRDNNGQLVTDGFGDVYMNDDQGSWRNARIENGRYRLSLLGGSEWRVGAHVEGGNFLDEGPANEKIFIGHGQTVEHDIILTRTDATITGQLLDPNGNPVEFGFAYAHEPFAPPQPGEEPKPPKGTGTEVRGGNFELNVVGGGEYQVGAGIPPELADNFLPPEEVTVFVPANGNAQAVLQFKQADGRITGTVYDSGGQRVDFGFVGGWSEKGSNSGAPIFDGRFSLNVTKDDSWHLRANTFEDETFFDSGEIVIRTPDATNFQIAKDITVAESQFVFPEPVSETFDASQPKVITLSDGTTITIPAGALASEGNVTVTINPTVDVRPMKSFKPLGFAYSMTATDENNTAISTFNVPVTISFPYDPDILEAMGLSPTDLIPSFFDTTTNTWTQVTTAVINEAAGRITFTITHFTDFALGSNAEANAVSPKRLLVMPGASGGPNIRIFDSSNTLTAGFFAYADGFRGGMNAVSVDLDGDGVDEIATIPASKGGPHLRVFDSNGTPLASTMITATSFRQGWQLAAGDVDGDGQNELVLGANAGGGPQVQVFQYDGDGTITREAAWFAYQLTYRGGVQVAVGDVDGDGTDDIVTAPNRGGGPNVSVFSKFGTPKARFFAYDQGMTGGVKLTLADVDQDGAADIITTPGAGRTANVAVHSGIGQTMSSFFALPESMRMGVTAQTGDVDGDGAMEIVAVPNAGGGPQVSIFSWQGNLERRFFAYDENLRSGLTAAVVDLEADGSVDIVTAPGKGGGPHVGVFNGDGTVKARYFSHQESFLGGITLSVGNE